MNLNIIAIGVLALSLIVNAVFGWAYLGQRDKATAAPVQAALATAQQDAQAAINVAEKCSSNTSKLGTLAAQRESDAAKARAAAQAASQEHAQQADAILSRNNPPGLSACESAQLRIDDFLKARAAQ